MAEGYAPVYAEQQNVVSNEFFMPISKSTRNTNGTVVFTNTTDRYVAILLIISNTGESSIYAVGTKITATSGNFVTKLAGSNINITVDSSGSISVPLPHWSQCIIWSSNEFS